MIHVRKEKASIALISEQPCEKALSAEEKKLFEQQEHKPSVNKCTDRKRSRSSTRQRPGQLIDHRSKQHKHRSTTREPRGSLLTVKPRTSAMQKKLTQPPNLDDDVRENGPLPVHINPVPAHEGRSVTSSWGSLTRIKCSTYIGMTVNSVMRLVANESAENLK